MMQNIQTKFGKDCSLDQWYEIQTIMNETPEITLSNTPFDIDDVSWYCTNKDGVFIVALFDKKVVGYVYGIQEGTCACLYYLGVAKEFRKHGIGNILIDSFFWYIKNWKIKSVYTLSTNPIMTDIAKKKGFTEGRKVTYLEMPWDKPILK